MLWVFSGAMGTFRLVSSRVMYRNRWMTLREERVLRPDGAPGCFGVLDLVAGSSVLAREPDGSVWLVREHKYALGRVSLEAVSGALEPGEAPLDAARRELAEELGFTAERWEAMGHIDAFTNTVRSPNHLFFAEGLCPGVPCPEPGEEPVAVKLPLDAALAALHRGEVTHSATVALLLHAALRER
ncbi:MAG: NUDIX hydrolase [Deltaproteobacteria bacterium]|nr:NUDIX hydrolase [Deltaproteobacteria bacterium]